MIAPPQDGVGLSPFHSLRVVRSGISSLKEPAKTRVFVWGEICCNTSSPVPRIACTFFNSFPKLGFKISVEI